MMKSFWKESCVWEMTVRETPWNHPFSNTKSLCLWSLNFGCDEGLQDGRGRPCTDFNMWLGQDVIVFFLPFQAVIWAGQKSVIPTNYVKLLQKWHLVVLVDQACYSVLHYTKLKTNDCVILCVYAPELVFLCFSSLLHGCWCIFKHWCQMALVYKAPSSHVSMAWVPWHRLWWTFHRQLQAKSELIRRIWRVHELLKDSIHHLPI